VPMFLTYHSGPDISRVTAFGLMVWSLVLLVWGFEISGRGARWLRPALATGIGASCLGGLMIGVSLLTAGPDVQLTARMYDIDAEISGQFWDQLAPGTQVFDVQGARAPTLFGRLNHNRTGNQAVGYGADASHDFLALNPTPENLLANGYRYLYADKNWLDGLSVKPFSQNCVTIWAAQKDGIDEEPVVRGLLDMEGCRRGTGFSRRLQQGVSWGQGC